MRSATSPSTNAAQFGFEGTFELGGVEGVDDIDGCGEEDIVALLAGGIAECGGEVGFAQADQAQEDDVAVIAHELEAEEVLDFEAVDFFGPVPSEGIEGFDDWEACGFDTPEDSTVGVSGSLAFDKLGEIVEMGEGVLGGLGGQGSAVFFHEREAEGLEVSVEDGEMVFHGVGVAGS